ncbi:hypothetical protein SAMN05192533_103200 [Mesobacillus persicus]|uniref:Immunity protein 17 n=1 Tax=Mesobacillus persicus TaxID=930146 RepID=A0A1H7YZ58_9BACI|nr:hypothetical protein [Mesobacillus persicus]SEM51293.1 hypothetical protein SAMN05192533_103200 [Mesobacillus persicus]
MGFFTAVLIILVVVVADYFLFDMDNKRWGWMKNSSKFTKTLFFSGFIIASILIYLGMSSEYFL